MCVRLLWVITFLHSTLCLILFVLHRTMKDTQPFIMPPTGKISIVDRSNNNNNNETLFTAWPIRTFWWQIFGKSCIFYFALYEAWYLTVILRGRAGYELIYITTEAVGRVGYYQLISGKFEKNNCFTKFSSNSLDFFGWNLLVTFSLPTTPRNNFFRPPKFQHKKFAISFSLFGQT